MIKKKPAIVIYALSVITSVSFIYWVYLSTGAILS